MSKDIDFSHAKRGVLISEPGKERVTVRIDTNVLAWFRQRVKGGGNYQTLINDTLRSAMDADHAPVTAGTLPDELAKVVRAKVADGEYATESEVIQEGLRMLIARDHAIEQWLRSEVATAYDEIKADPSKILTADQVRALDHRDRK